MSISCILIYYADVHTKCQSINNSYSPKKITKLFRKRFIKKKKKKSNLTIFIFLQ